MIAIGVVIGGTGIKSALVDTVRGELVSERLRTLTAGGAPGHIAAALAEQLAGFARAVAATGETRHTPAAAAEPSVSTWDAVRVALGVDRRSVARLARSIPSESTLPPAD